MKIIGIAGRKSSGKDTISDFLVGSEGFVKVALADPLKTMLSRIFNIEAKYFNDQKLKESELPYFIDVDYDHLDKLRNIVENEWQFPINLQQREKIEAIFGTRITTPRQLMQTFGSLLRDQVREDIWIVLLFSRLKGMDANIVVTDIRLQNERKSLQNAGAKMILVKRESLMNKDSHISENDLGKDDDYDVVIKNDDITLQELKSEVLMWYSVVVKYK